MMLLYVVSSIAQTSVWDGTSCDTSWFDETKTEYHITNAAQLKGLADLVNNNSITFEGKEIVLDVDIDLNGKLWTPIGNGYINGTRIFKGNFKGGSHTIANLSISNVTNPYGIAGASDYYCIGFFGVAKEGIISQIRINGEVTVENGYGCQNAGGLVGYAENCTIEKIIANFKLMVKQENGSGLLLGGVAGDATTSSFIGVSSSGEVLFYNNARMRKFFGGISGKAKSLGECSSDFTIVLPVVGTENCYIGGLAGYVGTVSDAIFTGKIDIYDYWNKQKVFVGGIAGNSQNSINNIISAPSYFSVQTQMPNIFQGLIVPNSSSCSIANARYLENLTSNPGSKGTPITASELKSGNTISGFNEEKWLFEVGEYPALRAIAEFGNTNNDDGDFKDDVVDEFGRIDGVYYELDQENKTAKVIGGSIKYTGDVIIKDAIISSGEKYCVTSIGYEAFFQCSSLTSVTIPDGVLVIGGLAFEGCSALTSIEIPNSVTKICNGAFSLCEGLKNIEIPNSVTVLEYLAFSDCTGLTSISIPKNLTNIGMGAFRGCSNLASIVVETGNSVYDSRDDSNAIIETASNNLLLGCKNTIIPNTVTSICKDASLDDGAFSDCYGLTSIEIPNSVTIIGNFAFSNCRNLTSVHIGNGVTNIGDCAFTNCVSLKSVSIPSSVTSTGFGIFSGCKGLNSVDIPTSLSALNHDFFYNCIGLTSVTIPQSITSIGNAFYGCIGLKEVYCYATDIEDISDYAFHNCDLSSATLYVPASAIEYFTLTAPWSSFGTITVIPEKEKCAVPTISYEKGKLIFMSETEGAICQFTITDKDIKTERGNEIQLSVTYNISVYATKDGFENSDVVTATLCWIDQEPKTEGITNSEANVPAKALLIQNNRGIINVQGADDGEHISIYGVNGMEVGSAISQNGMATINTSLQTGSVAIVKSGQKSIKVMLK